MAGEFAAALVVIWLTLTVAAQFDAAENWVGKIDPFQLLPRWTFFAPNPGVTDYHLVARLKSAEGELGSWKVVPLNAPRPRFAFLWNPGNRPSKVLNDAAQSIGILRQKEQFGDDGLPLCLPYLVLLHYAQQSIARDASGQEVQFALVESTGHNDRSLDFSYLSKFHPIKG